ncbi:MAG: 30S ribosome-binding factor RbfA [Candidatus Liptonbacteria bacterium]|nr:30S ribosome-binding factor RbfA [Candidatus Liptonbacteria bacterium]
MDYRNERMGNLIREELSKIIVRELEFENALVTITEVEVDKKLDKAKVMVSVIPSEKAKEVFKILDIARNSLQTILFRKLNLKPVPRIQFEIDRGLENAANVEKAFLEE